MRMDASQSGSTLAVNGKINTTILLCVVMLTAVVILFNLGMICVERLKSDTVLII